MKRREFLSKSSLLGGTILLPWIPVPSFSETSRKLKIGLIADLHQDIMHDGEDRLNAFLNAAKKENADFIMQMGDFCIPKEENKELLQLWKNHNRPSYHILGNHDTDGGYRKSQTMKFWNMKSRYYSFDAHGYHFVVLDGNDENPKPWSGYNRYVAKEQQDWLRQDLDNTDLSTFIFSHQTLENEEGGVANFEEVRAILEEANKKTNGSKVVASFSGHHHTDYMTNINGIYYIQINSASYRWVGEKFLKVRYSKEIDEQYPWIKYTIPYKDPLYTFVDIDPKGILRIKPKVTEFVGPGPKELMMPDQAENDPIVAKISDFNFSFKP